MLKKISFCCSSNSQNMWYLILGTCKLLKLLKMQFKSISVRHCWLSVEKRTYTSFLNFQHYLNLISSFIVTIIACSMSNFTCEPLPRDSSLPGSTRCIAHSPSCLMPQWKALKTADSCLMKPVIRNLDTVRVIEFTFSFPDLDSWK